MRDQQKSDMTLKRHAKRTSLDDAVWGKAQNVGALSCQISLVPEGALNVCCVVSISDRRSSLTGMASKYK